MSGRISIAGAITVAYLGVALLHGGYALTSLAWGAIIAWAIVAVLIVTARSAGVEVMKAAIAAAACFGGLAALSALSMLWANDAGRAFDAALLPGAYAGLLVLVLVSVPRVGPLTWLRGLAGGATATGVLALLTRLWPGFLGTNDAVTGTLAHAAQGRLSYPIGYWNGLAACIAISLVLLVWLGAEAQTRNGRAASIALIPLCGLALFFTSSRGGVLAVAVGIVVLTLVEQNRMRLVAGAALGLAATVLLALLAHGRYDLIHDLRTNAQERQGLEIGLIALGLAVAIGGLRWALDERLVRLRLSLSPAARGWGLLALLVILAAAVAASDPAARLRSFEHDSSATAVPGQRSLLSSSGSGRAQFWEAALDAFTSQPIHGVGAGNYELYWNAHPEAPIVTGNAHSLFLEELAELGPLGLLLALLPFALAVFAAVRRRSPSPPAAAALALLAAAAVGAAIDWTWKIPAAFCGAVVAIALLTSEARRARDADPGSDRNFAKQLGFGTGVATLLLGWGIAWIAGVVLFASLKLDASRAAVSHTELAAAADDARAAAAIEPFSPEPQLQLALIYELAGELRRARAAAGDMIDAATGDWRGWAIAARIDRRLGRPRAARREQAQTRALAPVPLPDQFRPRSRP